MADAIPYTPVTLSAVGQKTDWMDIGSAMPDGTMFIGRVSGTVTFVVDVANDETGGPQADKLDQVTLSPSLTTDVAKAIFGPRLPGFVRVRMTAGTGSVKISWGYTNNVRIKPTSRHA